MLSVVGIFQTLSDAGQAVAQIRAIPIAEENINLLSPGPPEQEKTELSQVPLSEAEQPGMGAGLGGVVGAAMGLAGGMAGGTAVASVFIPGIGPIVAIGLAAAAVVGAGGAVAGSKIGNALETASTPGIPEDELFFYEDALRSGHTVVIVLAEEKHQAEQIRSVFRNTGAESLDAAREKWWIGLRDTENIHYEEAGRHLENRESLYRSGFEAALRPGIRGKSYEEAKDSLRRTHPHCYADALFVRGYSRGQEFARQRKQDWLQGRVA